MIADIRRTQTPHPSFLLLASQKLKGTWAGASPVQDSTPHHTDNRQGHVIEGASMAISACIRPASSVSSAVRMYV
ncbi:hypothetical protein BDW22DRAFT_731944 [Trametopsis cervina]|nr:hypothetical protein BDW22DRAFT_731944 [Trametopsis cervina]